MHRRRGSHADTGKNSVVTSPSDRVKITSTHMCTYEPVTRFQQTDRDGERKIESAISKLFRDNFFPSAALFLHALIYLPDKID